MDEHLHRKVPYTQTTFEEVINLRGYQMLNGHHMPEPKTKDAYKFIFLRLIEYSLLV